MKLDLAVVGMRGDINLGNLCRLAHNFSLHQLHLVKPECPMQPVVAEFACKGLPYFQNLKIWDDLHSLAAADYHYVIGTTGKHGQRRLVHSVDELESIKHVFSQNNRVLLLFGRESRGLYQRELKYCHHALHIPLEDGDPVFNLSHAAAIILYQIHKLKGSVSTPKNPARIATGTEIHALNENMQAFLDSFQYYAKKERHTHKDILTQLLLRKALTADETMFLQGISRAYRNRERSKS